MPTIVMRKLKCKFTGSDDFLPEGIPRDKFMPVIAYEYQRREKEFEGKARIQEDLFYIVLNNKGKPTRIASFNCATMIDENAEINAGQLMQLLNNIIIMGKVISENMAKSSGETGSAKDTEQTG